VVVRCAIVAAPAIGLLILTQGILPGSPGSPGRGTPAAILFTGLVLGMLGSLTAAGLILIYRTARVINFAQTAIGVAGATLAFDLVQLTSVPFFVTLPLALGLSGVVGLTFEVAIVRRFFNSSRLVLTVATIAAASALAAFGPVLIRLLPFLPYRSASIEVTVGAAPVRADLPFAGWNFTIGSLPIEFGFPEIFAMQITVVSLILLAAFFRFTRTGVAVRALAENAERASLLGISVGTVSMVVWAIAGVLAGAGALGTGAVLTPAQANGIAPSLLLPALAAAVIARFQSLPVATYVSILLGVLTQAVAWSLPDDTGLLNIVLLIALGVSLLARWRQVGRSESGAGLAWQAVGEQRAIPPQLAGLTAVRVMRYGGLAVLGLIVLLYPWFVGTGATVIGGNVALISIAILSLVVLTGWSGQVSLGQMGYVAVGAVVAGALTARAGVPFWVAVPLAAAAAAAVAALTGLPALRVRGLFLAVMTLAFGMSVSAVLFNRRYFGWLLPEGVERPSLFLLDFEDERSMYYLCLAALAVSVAVIGNLRRSRFGRTVIAVRDNEASVQAFGVDPVRTKLAAFAVSGGLAGFAGALLAHHGRGVSVESFTPEASIAVFLFAVFGGVSSIGGAMLGSLYFNLVEFFSFGNPILNVIFKSSGQMFVLILLFSAPGGLISLTNRVRDGALRIIAQRRHIVVPSLFADFAPEVMERRLIPLSEPSGMEGLSALPGGDEWTLDSELHGRAPRKRENGSTPGVGGANGRGKLERTR